MPGPSIDLPALRDRCAGLDGLALLRALLDDGPFMDRIAFVSSFGIESAVILDMVATIDPAMPVLFIDTGKLFPETLQYRLVVADELGLRNVRIVRPTERAVIVGDPLGDLHGRDPDACCDLRKTVPLAAALAPFDGWVSGRKRFHGGLRAELPTLELEPGTGRLKVNPLAPWQADDVAAYMRLRDLPAHPLQAQGYTSVGCAPCTRPVVSGGGVRAGRWWGLDKMECGIHQPAAPSMDSSLSVQRQG